MSPLKATLLPVANSAVRHSQSGIERPRRIRNDRPFGDMTLASARARSWVRLSSDTHRAAACKHRTDAFFRLSGLRKP